MRLQLMLTRPPDFRDDRPVDIVASAKGVFQRIRTFSVAADGPAVTVRGGVPSLTYGTLLEHRRDFGEPSLSVASGILGRS